MAYKPEARITAAEAMCHPYFDCIRRPGTIQAATGVSLPVHYAQHEASPRVGGAGGSIGNVRKSSDDLNISGGAAKKNKTSNRASDPGDVVSSSNLSTVAVAYDPTQGEAGAK